MLSTFDDYPLHQAAVPILQPVDGDPNRYDRYFFHGYDADTGHIFVLALGIYPNRQIIDAAFCSSVDGEQHSVFTTGRLTANRATLVGPIEVQIVEPLRVLRVTVDAPDQGIHADLTFTARSPAVQEPRQTMMDRSRIVMDTCRFTQFGRWHGTLDVAGNHVNVEAATWAGTRDRSWGIRPLSGSTPAAPSTDIPGIWWLWSPMQFADHCLHVALTEDPTGHPVLRGANHVPDLTVDGDPADATDVEHARDIRATIDWEAGTRRARRADLRLERNAGSPAIEVSLEPVGRVFLRGAGYLNFDWPQGGWKDELAVGGEHLVHADLDKGDFSSLHVQQVCRVQQVVDGVSSPGVAVLEQLCIGPHGPSGFSDFLDLAP